MRLPSIARFVRISNLVLILFVASHTFVVMNTFWAPYGPVYNIHLLVYTYGFLVIEMSVTPRCRVQIVVRISKIELGKIE